MGLQLLDVVKLGAHKPDLVGAGDFGGALDRLDDGRGETRRIRFDDDEDDPMVGRHLRLDEFAVARADGGNDLLDEVADGLPGGFGGLEFD